MQTPPPGAPPPPFQPGPYYPYGPAYPPPPPGYLPPPYYWTPPPPPMYKWGPSSLNVDPSILAGLGYLFPIVGIVFFFVEKNNGFVKFHAAQSMLIYISFFILTIIGTVLIFGGIVLSIIVGSTDETGLASLSISLLSFVIQCGIAVIALVHIGFEIWGTVAGFMGQYVKMPLIGDIAERWAGGRPIPAY